MLANVGQNTCNVRQFIRYPLTSGNGRELRADHAQTYNHMQRSQGNVTFHVSILATSMFVTKDGIGGFGM